MPPAEAKCLTDGRTFATPEEALEHHDRYPKHTKWLLPSSWLMGAGVLSLDAFWREVRRGL